MHNPKVSIIISCYNVKKYLRECLDSVINQTLADIEIICVNDGSTDSTLEILREYTNKDSRIKVINRKNEGAGTSRNEGLNVAAGNYVLFFDADDYMDIQTLEKLYKNITINDSDITLCHSYDFMDGTNNINKIVYAVKYHLINNMSIFCPKDFSQYIFQFCVGWPWDKLYKRDFIVKNKLTFQNQHHSNDTKFVLLSLACANKISIIEDYLIYHRRHNTSSSNTRTRNPECFYNALIALKKELLAHNLYETYEQSFINYCITFPLWHIFTVNNKKAKKIMIKYLKQLYEKDINILKYDSLYFYDKKAHCQAIELLKDSLVANKIFSCKNAADKKHKVITILGLKIKIKRKSK